MDIPIYSIDDIKKEEPREVYDHSFENLVDRILDGEVCNTETQKGIFRLIKAKGTADLTPPQKLVAESFLNNFPQVCSRCSNDLMWDEIDIYEQSDKCHSCQHDLDNLKD